MATTGSKDCYAILQVPTAATPRTPGAVRTDRRGMDGPVNPDKRADHDRSAPPASAVVSAVDILCDLHLVSAVTGFPAQRHDHVS